MPRLLGWAQREIKLPLEDQLVIRDYFTHCKELFRAKYFQVILADMSPELKGVISRHMNKCVFRGGLVVGVVGSHRVRIQT
jgi:hypothetical protein